MAFAYSEAMTGIVKHIRNAVKLAFTAEYFFQWIDVPILLHIVV
jgi:hypothetical protein